VVRVVGRVPAAEGEVVAVDQRAQRALEGWAVGGEVRGPVAVAWVEDAGAVAVQVDGCGQTVGGDHLATGRGREQGERRDGRER
jgi:hypothetical protein